MEADLVMLDCGCNYAKKTFKEGSSCWYCVETRGTGTKSCWEWKAYRGFRVCADGRLRVRSHKKMMEDREAQKSLVNP
jgi:hypothetical protein